MRHQPYTSYDDLNIIIYIAFDDFYVIISV